MKFKLYLLKEESQLKKVPVKELTADEYKHIMLFRKMLQIVKTFMDSKKTTETYKQFRKSIAPFFKYEYAKNIKPLVSQTDKLLADIEAAKNEAPKILVDFNKNIDKLYKLFIDEKFDQAYELSKVVNKQTNTLKTSKESANKNLSNLKNPFEVFSAWFLPSNGMLSSFDADDMDRLLAKDIKTYKYTYLEFPKSMLNDFQYIVYYIQQLKSTDTPVELANGEFVKWQKYFYVDNKKYDILTSKVDDYLHSNNKKHIPAIMKLLQEFPDLIEENDKTRHKVKYVYRGVGGSFDNHYSIKEIEKIDKKEKYIATSISKHAANNFAEGKGHLMGDRTNDWGIILKYKVNPKAILLDTDIFGGIYNESEILIDVTKAKLDDYEYLSDREDYGY